MSLTNVIDIYPMSRKGVKLDLLADLKYNI